MCYEPSFQDCTLDSVIFCACLWNSTEFNMYEAIASLDCPTPSTDATDENAMCRILVVATSLDMDRLVCGLSIFLCLDLIDSSARPRRRSLIARHYVCVCVCLRFWIFVYSISIIGFYGVYMASSSAGASLRRRRSTIGEKRS